MEPASIVGLISASAALAKLAFLGIRELQMAHETYRDTEYSVDGVLSKLSVLRFSLGNLEIWGRSISSDEAAADLLIQLEVSITECTRVMTGIIAKLKPPPQEGFTFRDKARFTWNKSTLKECESELDSQMQAMQLLLQVAEL